MINKMGDKITAKETMIKAGVPVVPGGEGLLESIEETKTLAKEVGYTSIGHDLIYGLPFQTLEDVEDTILKTNSLLPDRISFYSYAHVPWLKGNGQRGFNDEDIPQCDAKRQLYELGKKMLLEIGFFCF